MSENLKNLEDEEEKKRKEEIHKLFKDFKSETEKRQVSSSENFDKSVLTYSSWALGISIAFLKDFIPINVAAVPVALYASWIAFGLAIGLTTISFLISYKGLEVSLSDAVKYYLEEDESYFNRDNVYNKVVKWFNRVSAITFILGLIFTLIFVSANLEKAAMEKSKLTRPNITHDGLPTAIMTKVLPVNGTLQKGLPAASMQPIPAQKPVAPVPTIPTTPSKTTGN